MAEPWLKVLLVAGPFRSPRFVRATRLRLAEGLAAHQIEATIVTPNADCVAPCRRERLAVSVYPRLNFPDLGAGRPRVDSPRPGRPTRRT